MKEERKVIDEFRLPGEPEWTPTQRLLESKISDISEEVFSAGWHTDIEFVLWDAIQRGGLTDGPVFLSGLHIHTVTALAEASGTWPYWGPEADGIRFVPLDEWKGLYEQWTKSQSGWKGNQ